MYSSGNRLMVDDFVRSVSAAGDLPVTINLSQASQQRGFRQRKIFTLNNPLLPADTRFEG